MKRKVLAWVLGISLAMLVMPAVAAAVDGPDTPGEEDLARVRKKVEALRAWQMSEVLNLDQETGAKLFPAMREADKETWRIEAANRELIRELDRELSNRRPDPGRINGILDRLQENRMEKARVEDRHLIRVREILSPEDTARYLLFQLRFQRELREKAASAYRESRGMQSSGVTRSDPDGGSGRSSGGGSGRK